MAVTLRVTAAIDGGEDAPTRLFGQLVFSGNYATGGDQVTLDFTAANTGGWGVYQKIRSLKATRGSSLLTANPVIDTGAYLGVIIPGTGNQPLPKIKVYVVSTGLELAAAAYPAALTLAGGNTQSTLEVYFKNL